MTAAEPSVLNSGNFLLEKSMSLLFGLAGNQAYIFDSVPIICESEQLSLKTLRKGDKGAPLPNRPASIVNWDRQKIVVFINHLQNFDVAFAHQVDVQETQIFLIGYMLHAVSQSINLRGIKDKLIVADTVCSHSADDNGFIQLVIHY